MTYTSADTALIENAFAYREQGAYFEALDILHSLEIKYVNDKVVNGTLAILYFELEDFESSEGYFKKATQLNPQSEIASIGLFHSLFNQGKTLAGLKEIQRFTSSNKYKLYKITVKELKCNIVVFDEWEQKIISKLK